MDIASLSEPTRRAALHRQMVDELAELGMDLARMVHQEAKQHAEAGVPGAAAAATVAFDRVARAVRRTLLLARKLDEPVGADAAADRVAVRKRIIRSVEDTIDREASGREAGGREAGEALHAELLERLEAPELEDEILRRPVEEIIREICKDLGLEDVGGVRLWRRRTPEDVAALCARAAMPARGAPEVRGRVALVADG